MRKLIKSQQGELDGAVTYLKLAETVHNKKDADAFRILAADEGRHAAVFRRYTKTDLRPNKLQAYIVVAFYRLFGKRILYPIISGFEYAAIPRYRRIMEEYPEVEGVMNDEKRHGDTLKSLMSNGEYNDKAIFPGIVLVTSVILVIIKFRRYKKVDYKR